MSLKHLFVSALVVVTFPLSAVLLLLQLSWTVAENIHTELSE